VAVTSATSRTGLGGQVNYVLVMRNERDDLVIVGPVSIDYWAAMIDDELGESGAWTAAGIATVLTGEQARTALPRAGAWPAGKTCCPLPGGVSAWQPGSLASPPAAGGGSLSRKEGRR
jgi:hypothetical protein